MQKTASLFVFVRPYDRMLGFEDELAWHQSEVTPAAVERDMRSSGAHHLFLRPLVFAFQ